MLTTMFAQTPHTLTLLELFLCAVRMPSQGLPPQLVVLEVFVFI